MKLNKSFIATDKQLTFIYTILTEIHTWELSRNLENNWRAHLRNVYENGIYNEREKSVLKVIRGRYVEQKRKENEMVK
jgi:high-affinity Fe2+/Pb2+ permease